jgi:hypothetical protein
MTDTSTKSIERLHERLGGVHVPEHMHGDNLAILLCSFFEDHEGEIGENGWTDAAIAGQDAVLSAIRDHYGPTLRALAAERDALRAEVDRLRAKLDAPGDMHWYALEPEGYLECWSTPIADNWDGPDHVYKLMAAHSRPDIFVTGEVKSLDDDGEPQDIEPVWFRTREEARGHFQRSLERLRAALGDAP